MTNYALLNNVEHQDIRIITDRSAEYGDDVMYAAIFPFEFRAVQSIYPILFHRDANGMYFPVALFGFQQGENLFLDDTGWRANYIPAMIRREPFLIGYQKTADGEDSTGVVSLDMSHRRISQDRGERLFQPLGGYTPFLEETTRLLENLFEGQDHCRAFVEALSAAELIESATFDITLKDGSKNQLLGFYTINEDRLQDLPGDVLEEFSRRGFLMPLFMIVASVPNMQTLVDLKNDKLST